MNHVRLNKQMHFPCELIEIEGDCETKEFREVEEKINFKWKCQFSQILKLSPKTKETWKDFIELIANQEFAAMNDFNNSIFYEYQIARDRLYLQEKFPTKIAHKKEVSYDRLVCIEIDKNMERE